MARKARKPAAQGKKKIEHYDHRDKQRLNNPPVGLVTPDTDPLEPPAQARKHYQYDPHLDPQLVWAGKAERTSFEVPTVSLHIHERIDPKTIIEAVRAKNGNGRDAQLPLFARPEENPALRDAVDFYNHKKPLGWKNRLIAGDSLLVMNSLLEKEGLGGQVQMVYIDPPYGIRYGSNFQPFVNKRDVKDGSDDDLTLEPETLKAFRDTWELGIHSYLTYLRDRLLLAKELLHESGSCFVQISDENIHHVRELMDEVFGSANLCAVICFQKTGGQRSNLLSRNADFLVWYARDVLRVKYRQLLSTKEENDAEAMGYGMVELPDGQRRRMTTGEANGRDTLPRGSRLFQPTSLTSQNPGSRYEVRFEDQTYYPNAGQWWKTDAERIQRLIAARRIIPVGNTLRYVRYFSDFPVYPLSAVWSDTGVAGYASDKKYAVETNAKVIERCLLMTTDPGDLVLDPTCGSGTTAYVAEQWGRRWITTDTSRVAITLARQRLMTATFDYYALAHPEQGVGSGFKYKTVPHVTLKSIANNPEIKEGMTREQIDRAIAKYADTETLYDQPEVDNKKARVTGPFTVEAVPAAAFGQPEVRPIAPVGPVCRTGPEDGAGAPEAERSRPAGGTYLDASIAREGQTLRQAEWRAELLKTGIRGKGEAKIEFVRVEPLPGTRWLQCDAEVKDPQMAQMKTDSSSESAKSAKSADSSSSRRAVISFGPEHAPLEQRQVEAAIEEAQKLVPRPALVIFAALQFDPEAAKDIDETNWPGVTLLKAQMNGDLVTEDLKKKRSSNESFWLIGQPDIELRKVSAHVEPASSRSARQDAGPTHFQVEIHGFDYYNPKSGKVESGGKGNIAMWMLDPDYDGRSVYPRQVFFPMAGPKDGWARLARNLKAEVDPDLIEQYRGTVSLPFERGKHGRAAVKIVDDRGIESLRIVEVPVIDRLG